MVSVVLVVPGISCEHCERTVTRVLGPVPGVERVSVDISAKQVRVTYDAARVTVEQMKDALAAEDYPVASVAPAD